MGKPFPPQNTDLAVSSRQRCAERILSGGKHSVYKENPSRMGGPGGNVDAFPNGFAVGHALPYRVASETVD